MVKNSRDDIRKVKHIQIFQKKTKIVDFRWNLEKNKVRFPFYCNVFFFSVGVSVNSIL